MSAPCDAWCLTERLNGSDHAETWTAVCASGARGVIKCPKRRPDQARFLFSANAAKSHGQCLPILGGSFSDYSSRWRRPWMATPVADPSSHALEHASLREVVRAVERLTELVCELADLGFSHWNIRPSNFLLLDGCWYLSDLSAADFVLDELHGSKALAAGRLAYFAPEMLGEPAVAAGHLVDVYAIGKTLWALAAAQRHPPIGAHVIGDATSIGRYRADPSARELDTIIEACTDSPGERPSLIEALTELRAWLELYADATSLADLRENLRANDQPEAAARTRQVRAIEEAWQAVAETMAPMVLSLASSSGHVYGGVRHRPLEDLLQTVSDRAAIAEPYTRTSWAVIVPGRDGRVNTRVVGVCIEAVGGEVRVTGGRVSGEDRLDWKTDSRTAKAGTIASRLNARRIAADILGRDGLTALAG